MEFLTTEKEAIEYAIVMFASEPYGFLDTNKEEDVKKQFYIFQELAKKHKINFKEAVCATNRGQKLFNKFGY